MNSASRSDMHLSTDRPTAGKSGEMPEVVSCWSNLGVYGDGTCKELVKHVHCHHCPTFSAAGQQLLDRPLTADYRAERTSQFAVEKELREPTTTSAVLFRIRAEWLALPTSIFQEVTEKRPIHSLPHRRKGYVLGLANVRGELLICISLGHLLGMEDMPSLEELRRSAYRLLVVQCENTRFAFLVEEVQGPCRFQSQALRPLPATLVASNPACTRAVIAWEDRAVGMLSPEALMGAFNRGLS